MSRLLLASAIVGILSAPIQAMSLPFIPPGQRLTAAKYVVVGKVSAIEEKTVEVNKAVYHIAVVKISDSISGAKGFTSVRVGFIMPNQVAPPAPINLPPNGGRAIGPVIRRPYRPGITLAVGMEALFYLRALPGADFTVLTFGDVVNKQNNANFDKTVAGLKHCVELLEKPAAGLESKDVKDRFITASLLISRYRQRTAPAMREEPIAAAQSKLILQALADADWNVRDEILQMTPTQSFRSLGLTVQDGFNPGQLKNYAVEYPLAAKKWLKDNTGKYRIKRFVAEEKK